MDITTRTGLVGFFLALSTLPISGGMAATSQAATPDATPQNAQPIESRLARLTEAIRQREILLSTELPLPHDVLIARAAWGNGGGGGFANRTGPGGFVNGAGGGFVNAGGFRNGGFVNSGGFKNGSFANGGGFRNGGGFYNYW